MWRAESFPLPSTHKLSYTVSVVQGEARRPPPAPENGSVHDPLFHYEPATWSLVLGTEKKEGPWKSWEALCRTSRAATMSGERGWYSQFAKALSCLKVYASRISEVWNAQARNEP